MHDNIEDHFQFMIRNKVDITHLQDGYDVFARSLGKANTYSGNPEESAYPDIGKRFGDLADELQAELTKAGEGPHDKGELIKKIAIAHRKLLKGKDLSTDEGAGNHPELKRLTPAMKKTIKPPPIMIKIHMAKINENIERFIKYSLPP